MLEAAEETDASQVVVVSLVPAPTSSRAPPNTKQTRTEQLVSREGEMGAIRDVRPHMHA